MRILLSYWRPLVGALWLATVGGLTLRPGAVEASWLAELPPLCAICGARGTADVLLNIVLFLPLGMVLGGLRRGALRALLWGAAISGGIELVQSTLPGRHPSAADVVLNAVGAWLGTVVYRAIRERLRTSARPVPESTQEAGSRPFRISQTPDLLGRCRGWHWGASIGLCFLVAGALLTPNPTDDDYWGQWTPDLGSMPQYDGRVLAATLNDRSMQSRRLDHAHPHRELLGGDWRLEGRILVGTGPASVSPILSIYDGHQREVLLLGAHGDALVFRERILANRLRFDAPDVRIADAFGALEPGDTASIAASRRDGVTCLRLGAVERCGVGVSAGRTWGLLLYVEGPTEPFRQLVDLLWLAGLFLPVGFFARSRGDALAGVALGVGGLLLASAMTAMVLGPTLEVAACAVGVILGRLAVALLRPMARGHPTPAASMESSV